MVKSGMNDRYHGSLVLIGDLSLLCHGCFDGQKNAPSLRYNSFDEYFLFE